MYNYNHLYYFYITAKAGNVSVAAKHLRISQPSLSSQLKVLESALDVRLFQRVGRTKQLTDAGSAIFGICRQMFEVSEEMHEVVSKGVPSVSRRIHIGVSDEVDRPFVADIVSQFLTKHGLSQRPRVSVVSGSHAQLAERLRFRELDAVVTEIAMIDNELVNLERAEVPVALTCSSSWKVRIAKKDKKVRAALEAIQGGTDAEWLMPSSRFKLRSEIDRFFEANDLKGRVILESDVIASLVRSVVDGLGVAFLPLLYVAREIRAKSIRVIGPSQGYWKYRVWIACHRQNKDDILIRALARSFTEISAHALKG